VRSARRGRSCYLPQYAVGLGPPRTWHRAVFARHPDRLLVVPSKSCGLRHRRRARWSVDYVVRRHYFRSGYARRPAAALRSPSITAIPPCCPIADLCRARDDAVDSRAISGAVRAERGAQRHHQCLERRILAALQCPPCGDCWWNGVLHIVVSTPDSNSANIPARWPMGELIGPLLWSA